MKSDVLKIYCVIGQDKVVAWPIIICEQLNGKGCVDVTVKSNAIADTSKITIIFIISR